MKSTADPRCGSALLLVMWALLMLSAAVFAWSSWIQDGITLHGETNRALEATAMAHSGLTLGLHPLVSRQTPLPDETLGQGMGFRVRMESEGGKLNVNWLLRGEDPRKIALFKQWLERRGLEFTQRETLVDCLLDYIDADGVKRLNGAEDDGDYHPANRELLSVDEIANVRGSAPLTTQPGWQEQLTVYSQGPIDVGAAPLEILELLPPLGESRLQRFVQDRGGRDGLDGTPDDVIYPNLETVRSFLGVSAAQFASWSDLVMCNDPTWRVIGSGFSGSVSRQAEAVARKQNGKTQILAWHE